MIGFYARQKGITPFGFSRSMLAMKSGENRRYRLFFSSRESGITNFIKNGLAEREICSRLTHVVFISSWRQN